MRKGTKVYSTWIDSNGLPCIQEGTIVGPCKDSGLMKWWVRYADDGHGAPYTADRDLSKLHRKRQQAVDELRHDVLKRIHQLADVLLDIDNV